MFPSLPINHKNGVLDQVPQHQSTPISKLPLLKVRRKNRLHVLWIDGEDFFREERCRGLVRCGPFGVSFDRSLQIGLIGDILDGEPEVGGLWHHGSRGLTPMLGCEGSVSLCFDEPLDGVG
jgi:hypothetical protein